jgi:hypothetical protein
MSGKQISNNDYTCPVSIFLPIAVSLKATAEISYFIGRQLQNARASSGFLVVAFKKKTLLYHHTYDVFI